MASACAARYLTVDLTHMDCLNTGVLGDLAENTSVATADDEHLLRGLVRIDGYVCDHLLVRKLVSLGELNYTVENQHPAVSLRLEYQNILS